MKPTQLLFIFLSLTTVSFAQPEAPTTTEEAREEKPAEKVLDRQKRSSISMVGALKSSTLDVSSKMGNNTSTLSAAGTGWGIGVLPEIRFSRVVGLELGTFYLPRNITDSGVTMSQRRIELSPLMRFHFLNNVLSAAVGAYFSQSLGDISFEKDGVTRDLSYSDAKIKTFDTGLAASVGAGVPIAKRWDLVGDVRYQYGLTKIVDEKIDLLELNGSISGRFRGLIGLLGVRTYF